MDLTLILLVVLLVVVVVVFALALRGGRRGENVPAAGNAAEQQAPVRPAIAAPQGQVPGADDAGAHGERQQAPAARATPPAQVTTAATTTQEASAALPVAPAQGETAPVAEAAVPRVEAPVARQSSEPGDTSTREAARTDDRVIVHGVPVIERGGPAVETGHAPAVETGHASAVTVDASAAGTGIVIDRADAPPDAAPVAPPAVPADGASSAPAPAMELVVQPPTRSGAVMLSVAPQRLPFRLAELLGEQRGLEEAITIAHRRIDDVELGPDPGAAESRVRLAVLRQDLTQKQERLREILFLQDGYRWVQQHLAPDHASSEG